MGVRLAPHRLDIDLSHWGSEYSYVVLYDGRACERSSSPTSIITSKRMRSEAKR